MNTQRISAVLLTLAVFAVHVAANADKIIFTGPEPVTYPLASPSLADLNLDVLGPENLSIRRNLTRIFHDDSDLELKGKPRGHASWYLIDNLTPGQRYELRVCWAAIEPTAFTMNVYELDTVWDTPDLMLSLADYSSARQPAAAEDQAPQVHRRSSSAANARERRASLLLLQVHAAADYFSHHEELMRDPPPVLVDLILDPYLLNAVPESLVLTAAYVVLVAVATFFLARWIADRMTAIATSGRRVSKKRD
ncbi:hypothetical protein ISF_08158 [Cordyceps fumosorosea ARSEF 2679]|uniref:Uncharacterized protein n=1 Tax=Cordyceps fumosorosea (strain ARSEF 2679) TaxID=1081104 RepID=A0A167MY08_CORFA|nr:hypothetical protein ISF_08158 [Cordyceps fumosorosea ARSEF 2679]OAA54887.1 hypothetical protein ISF_08158 [Cordyceps fumosorosea ARSEF 2679]